MPLLEAHRTEFTEPRNIAPLESYPTPVSIYPEQVKRPHVRSISSPGQCRWKKLSQDNDTSHSSNTALKQQIQKLKITINHDVYHNRRDQHRPQRQLPQQSGQPL